MDAVNSSLLQSEVNPFQNLSGNAYVENEIYFWDKATQITAEVAAYALYPFNTARMWWFGRSNKPTPPSANGHFLLGSIPELAQHNWEVLPFLNSYLKTYGGEGLCRVQLGQKTFCIVTDPNLVDIILKQPLNFVRGPSFESWQLFSKGGLSEGEKTNENRGKAIEAIGEKNYHIFFPAIMAASKEWIKRLSILARKDKPIDLMKECGKATLSALGEAFFKPNPCDVNPFNLLPENEQVCEDFIDAYHTVFKLIAQQMTSSVNNLPVVGKKIYPKLYQKEMQAFENAKSTIAKILRPIYKNLLEDPRGIDGNSNFFRLITLFGVNLSNPDYDQILDESIGFLQAAFETSSKSLGWTLYALASHQEIQDKLYDELQGLFGKYPPSSKAELDKSTLLRQVVFESLRLYPPFPFTLRDVLDPKKFDKYEVNPLETFVIAPFYLHRNEKNWTNPEEFMPERFTEEMLSDDWQKKQTSFLPFAGGAHRCPGRFKAVQDLCTLVMHFVQNYKVSLAPDQSPPEPEFSITLQSKNPILVNLTPR